MTPFPKVLSDLSPQEAPVVEPKPSFYVKCHIPSCERIIGVAVDPKGCASLERVWCADHT